MFQQALVEGRLSLFIPRFNYLVERCSKSSCTLCTLRFLRSVRLALVPLMTINGGAPLQGLLLFAYQLDKHLAVSWAVVMIDIDDLLPCSPYKLAPVDRHRYPGSHERGPHV